MSCYLLELETINIFNTSTNKIIFCKTAELAYDYGLKIEPLIRRDVINSLEKAIDNKIIWESNRNNFPKYKCKINCINSDIMWALYHNIENKFTVHPQTSRLIHNIYSALKTNEVI